DCYDYSFFFSSRRRHTRSKRDWSSDVCSSDLVGDAKITGAHGLDVTRIVHAVGPDYRDEDQRETAHEKLASAYRRALEVAASVEIGRASCRDRGKMTGGGVARKQIEGR